MPLLATDEILPLLTSPCCGSALVELRCTSCQQQYGRIGQWPILVDFRSSVLVAGDLQASSGASAINRRRGRIARLAKRFFAHSNPVAKSNIARMRRMLPPNAWVLIVGGGSKGEGTAELYADSDLALVSFDIYGSENVQLIADAHKIPFGRDTFDGVLIQAVLEHVLDPNAVVDEISRVLRPHGVLYAETPFLQHVHEGPWDFTRFTDSGHRWLFRAFHRVESGPIGGPADQLVWSLSYLSWGLFRSRNAARTVRALLGWIRVLDRLIPREYRIDAATGTYFLGTNSGDPVTQHDAIAGYEGAQRSR